MADRKKGEERAKRRHEARKNQKPLVVNVADSDILLYGAIDEYEINAKSVNDAVKKLGDAKEITVRLNSGGGSVFEGITIYNLLHQHPAKIIVNIEGAALSIASVIAMAGDEIRMASNALFMIHDPRMWAGGTSKDLRKDAELLDKAAETIKNTYVARTGLDAAKVEELMAAETWLSAEEALELGFVTEVVDAKQVTAAFDPSNFSSIPGRFAKLVADAGEESTSTITNEGEMNEALRKLFVSLGMDKQLSDADAQVWGAENLNTILASKPSIDVKEIVEALKPADKTADIINAVLKTVEDREAKKAAEQKAFRAEVDANLELVFGDAIPEDVKAKCYAAGDLTAARAILKDARAKSQGDDLRIVFASQQPRDQHKLDVSTAVQLRAMGTAGFSNEVIDRAIPADKRGKGWQNFANVSLLNIAKECLLIDGVDPRLVSRLSNPDIAKAAFGFARATSLRNDGIATHVTSSLAEITRDAINKSLLAAYQESPQTWRGPMRQAASVPDFKQIHRIRLGAVANLPIWPDNTVPESAQLSNEKVSYAVEARAEKVSFSWQLFVNDDMDALSRIPKLMGDAAARTVNATAWAQITSNPTMPDGQALFSAATGNRKRQNLTTGTGAPSTTTVGALTTLMRLMRGLNTPEQNESQDILNLTPSYFVVPAAIETVAKVLVNSAAEPAATYNSGVYNPNSYLKVVVEPLLDASSTTAWYLFADPVRIDTVEVTFLQGQETPVTNDWVDEETLSRNFTVIQTFAAKAIDHRGMQKHAGA